MGRRARYLIDRLKLTYGRAMAAVLFALVGVRDRRRLERIGTDYGGWYCDPSLLPQGGVAVCCGAGEDVSFDVALNARYRMRVLCVDPTARAVAHVRALLAAQRAGSTMLIEAGPLTYDLAGFNPAAFELIDAAVWSEDGTLKLFAPRDPTHVSYSALNLQHTSSVVTVRATTLATLLAARGIGAIALLKLDIEGAEYAVLRSMLSGAVRPRQLLVEFDQVNQPLNPAFWLELLGVLRALRAAGYALVHRERANHLFILTAPGS
ncbi:MAG: FkbM family methyltransferase [Proteobacteria bacterium]|nr:FkbM family methyltransferase [Pseudomonadota bacterium]